MYTVLDNREQGIYRNLIDECWVSGSITSDPEVLARFVREPIDYFAQFWAKVRKKFRSIQNGDRLVHPRLFQDRRRLKKVRKVRSHAASTAAIERWNKANKDKKIHALRNASGMADSDTDSDNTNTGNQREAPARYGEFQSVILTGIEVEKLKVRMEETYERLLAELDRYSQTHPREFKQYRSHYAVLLTWHARELEKGNSHGKPKETYGDRIVRENRETAERINRELLAPDGDGSGAEDTRRTIGALLPRPE